MVFRESRPSRHRATDERSSDTVQDHEMESFLASIAPGRGDSTAESASEKTARFVDTKVFHVQVPMLRGEQLRRLAEQQNMSPTALMLEWVLQRLDQEDQHSIAPAPRREADGVPSAVESSRPPTDPQEPATVLLGDGPKVETSQPLSPVDQLNPIGDLTAVTPVGPAAPVTPLFRNPPGAHASAKEKKSRGPRHRAPEPVISLHTRRKF